MNLPAAMIVLLVTVILVVGIQESARVNAAMVILKLAVVSIDTALLAPVVVAVAAVNQRAGYRVCQLWARVNVLVCGARVHAQHLVTLGVPALAPEAFARHEEQVQRGIASRQIQAILVVETPIAREIDDRHAAATELALDRVAVGECLAKFVRQLHVIDLRDEARAPPLRLPTSQLE